MVTPLAVHRFEQHSALASHARPVAVQHLPLTQPLPGQTVPQVPQWSGLVCRFTQAPEHSVCPDGQLHWPALQVAPAGQTCPHAPQCFASLCRFTQLAVSQVPMSQYLGRSGGQAHLPFKQTSGATQQLSPQQVTLRPGQPVLHLGLLPQHTKLESEEVIHWPETQQLGSAHLRPHAPQFFWSNCSDTQAPKQSVVPDGHTHFPALQVAPGGQTCPHPPQFLGSVCRFTQAPLHAV
jgi:hypothetical protein